VAHNFTLTLRACGGVISPVRQWIENFDLPVERERGLSDRDNHLQVGEALLELAPGRWVGIVGSLEADPSPDLEAALKRRQRWQRDVLDGAALHVPEMAGAPAWIAQLLLAADSFLIARPLPGQPNGKSVIAGYPWFGDWGRDTLISLPGLTLAAGRQEWGRDILLTFARFVDRGMLPNVFPGAGDKPEYTPSMRLCGSLRPGALIWRRAAIAKPSPGVSDARWNSRQSAPGHPLRHPCRSQGRAGHRRRAGRATHLDGCQGRRLGGHARIGKPVEINALWYNALCVMTAFAEALGRPAELYRSLADRVRVSFARFADEHTGGLYDVLDGPLGDDGPVRPNQIFAVSLPHSPLPPTTQAQVVALVGRRLLTSYGLRSLSADHPDYKPHYTGDPWHRDGAYHQGTVWAWLLGHYALAEYRVHGDADSALKRIAAMRDHLFDAGLGTISEIFERNRHISRAVRPRRPGRLPACSKPGGESNGRLLYRSDNRSEFPSISKARILASGGAVAGLPEPSRSRDMIAVSSRNSVCCASERPVSSARAASRWRMPGVMRHAQHDPFLRLREPRTAWRSAGRLSAARHHCHTRLTAWRRLLDRQCDIAADHARCGCPPPS